MDVLTLLGVAFAIWLMLAAFMAGAWAVEQRTGNSGWVDVTWTAALGTTGILGAFAVLDPADVTGRQWLVAALVLGWALRLAAHIAWRTANVSDDPRYKKLRAEWGASAPAKMLWLLQAQAILSVPMVLSSVLAAWNPAPLFSWIDIVAISVFVIGLAGSAVADWQLSQFKRVAKDTGRVCNVGLWSWSRHPNYFFEWLVWVGLALLAIDMSGEWLWGLIALGGPVCMYWLLRFVSGVPPLEEHMLAKYGDRYARYQQETSSFFPLPPVRHGI
ncbi:MAG: DUF1295 domain-containing protein [Filomicrobium sp.]